MCVKVESHVAAIQSSGRKVVVKFLSSTEFSCHLDLSRNDVEAWRKNFLNRRRGIRASTPAQWSVIRARRGSTSVQLI